MNPLKKLAEELDQQASAKQPPRVNHTLKLNQWDYQKLQSYCKERGLTVSQVVERLISEFLTATKD